ncbi:programmed cell death 6-interacting protein [Drosophila persimilis]|uniref:Programmed cell death 6-interacting protein n=1 Tax=Drosophila pseudoobscura pseudoobscura TaxID=46245 RepID=A0A6I8UML4_DROPS|nr:programmed cell death 6-interacting protein [Drosophila pseudoobscura]XP_026840222.1 programmed cell death 6-interacting protein [Drosophila persimilis]
MSKFLSVPLKKPSEVDIVKPLNNLIQSTYNGASEEEKAKYLEAVNEFAKQRNTAIWKFFEKYEASLEVVYAYYDQICALETKISVSELQIPFKWKDAFDKGSIFGGKISLTHTSLLYEKVCVLFNIAALQSSIAASQQLDNDEGLKMAIKLLQQSAGIFQYLKGATPAAVPSEPTPDISQDTLVVMQALMVAQAQEVFILKAIKDNMNNLIIAKLCCQGEEFYADVLRAMQKESVRSLWEKEWIPTVAGKQAGFHALTQLYQSLVCRAAKKIGEEIARLRNAIDLFKAAQSRGGNETYLDEYFSRAKRHLAESTKDNEFIYNEMIPELSTLASPGKAQLAKSLGIASPMASNFRDIFTNLVPVELHRALTASDMRKNEIVNVEIMKLRESTQTLNAVLASLNLPAAVETADSNSGLPPSLKEKAVEVRQKGGVENVKTMLKELPDLLNRNREILDETERLLDEERDSDNQLRAQFKERWTRISSDKLTEMFRTNAKKYREVINNAIEADKVVRQKFESNQNGIQLLSMSPEEIQQSLPSASGSVDPNCSSVQRLKQLMEDVETIKAERDAIESELKSATFDMKNEFLLALQKDGAIDEPALSLSRIGQVLNPLQQQVRESVDRQQSLVADIQSAHGAFVSETGSCGSSRDTLYQELATAYDSYIELSGNLQEGTKFYNDLTQLLVVFQNKISDFVFARKTEKEELMKDLTTASSRQACPATPSLPSHYASTSGSGSDIPSNPAGSAPSVPAAAAAANMPYPSQVHGMPVPYGAQQGMPYPAYVPPPMPQSFNPYATLPYPGNFQYPGGYPQGPPPGHYGTYPGSYAPQQQGGYPNQKPPGW